MQRYLEACGIVAVHALKGEVKAQIYCDSSAFLKQFELLYLDKNGEKPLNIQNLREHKGMAIIQFEQITTAEEAYTLRGQTLYFDREDAQIDGDSHFICDLFGLDIIDAKTSRVYGKITDVINCGGSDIYVIRTPQGTAMLPAVDEFVERIDLERGVFVNPIEGIFSGEEESEE